MRFVADTWLENHSQPPEEKKRTPLVLVGAPTKRASVVTYFNILLAVPSSSPVHPLRLSCIRVRCSNRGLRRRPSVKENGRAMGVSVSAALYPHVYVCTTWYAVECAGLMCVCGAFVPHRRTSPLLAWQ